MAPTCQIGVGSGRVIGSPRRARGRMRQPGQARCRAGRQSRPGASGFKVVALTEAGPDRGA